MVTGTPGPMGYGWTMNWASSLVKGNPVPGDIYTLDGRATATGTFREIVVVGDIGVR